MPKYSALISTAIHAARAGSETGTITVQYAADGTADVLNEDSAFHAMIGYQFDGDGNTVYDAPGEAKMRIG